MSFVYMGGFIADPNTSYDRWDAEQAEWLRKCPTCGKCGEKIQSEYCWEIEPGEVWCESCTEEWMNDQRKDVDELMNEGR